MILQNMCDAIGGMSDPVRRNRNAQWKPKSVVYKVWKAGNNMSTGGRIWLALLTALTDRQYGNLQGTRITAVLIVNCPPVVNMRCDTSENFPGACFTLGRLTETKPKRAEEDHLLD